MRTMSTIRLLTAIAAAGVLAGCASYRSPATTDVSLTGTQEVPPVATSGMGEGRISVDADRNVSGRITVSGMDATAAHIHTGGPGMSGPPVIPLVEVEDNTFEVPAGTRLTEAQYAQYQAGELYVNVHSPSYPNGEVRAQLKPQEASGSVGGGGGAGGMGGGGGGGGY